MIELHYPLGDVPPPNGQAMPVAEGVKWVRMALPFALNHINLWLLRDELDGREGWTVIDCGLGDEATRAAWESVFARELDGLPVLRVIVTHMHPDHVGCAAWLTTRWSTQVQECRLWMSLGDYFGARLARDRDAGPAGERAADWFAAHGLDDPGLLDGIRKRGGYFSALVPDLPASYRRIRGGERLHIGERHWECVAGYGHAPEHQSLHAPAGELLVSGDMLLPRISTNVSVMEWEPEADPLALYLESLQALSHLPEETLVLPSHGLPFRGLHARITALQRHHAERLDVALQACRAQPRSAAELLGSLFNRALDLHQTTFAMGEAIAHLNHLWLGGKMDRERDGAGVWRFRSV